MILATRKNLSSVTLALVLIAVFAPPPPVEAVPLLEFCEHSSADRQLRASKGSSSGTADCVPLVEKKAPPPTDDRKSTESTRQLKIENLQHEVATLERRIGEL
mgnify:FL=1